MPMDAPVVHIDIGAVRGNLRKTALDMQSALLVTFHTLTGRMHCSKLLC